MAKSFRKLDPQKVLKLKQQGLSNSLIAERLGVSQGAIYHVLRKIQLSREQAPITDSDSMISPSSFS